MNPNYKVLFRNEKDHLVPTYVVLSSKASYKNILKRAFGEHRPPPRHIQSSSGGSNEVAFYYL